MTCNLPAPHWIDLNQIGLKSAIENVVDGYITLEFASAIPVLPATSIQYLIYFSTDVDTIFDIPKLIATAERVSIPGTILTTNHYIAAHVAQMGISNDISSANLTLVADNVYLFPSATSIRSALMPGSTHVVVETSAGLPVTDGYIKVADEVIFYSSIEDGYDGYQGLVIQNRDPFGCNDVTSHTIGTTAKLFGGFQDVNNRRFKPVVGSGMPLPTWEDKFLAGVKRVEDLGIGTSVKVEWYDGKAPPGFSREYFNVYQSTLLHTLFGGQPIGFSTNLEAVIPSLDPGKSYYYGVRLAYQLNNIQTSGFDTVASGFFRYPDPVEIDQTDGYFNLGETGTLFVSSTDGFPISGFLQIDSEILQYNSITSNSFNIVARDLYSTGWSEDYPNGTLIRYFKGIEDRNRRFYRGVPSWDAGLEVPKMPLPDGYNGIPADGYNGLAYNQDEDGYRSILEDIVTEDHSSFEEDNGDFNQFPYCGYRTPNYVKLYSQQQCGTYQGGRRMMIIPGVNNGQPVPVSGGVNVFEAAEQREEVILGLTGEPFTLLRRKTTGKKCPRLSIRSEHPYARCGTCFGTTFFGGYDRYSNLRELRPDEPNVNGFIQMRVSPYNNDLELTPDRALAQIDQLEAWTIAVPTIKDRDILIRYNIDEQGNISEEFRYEVLHVNRNKLMFGKDGKQTISMKKLDKTHEIYKYRIPVI